MTNDNRPTCGYCGYWREQCGFDPCRFDDYLPETNPARLGPGRLVKLEMQRRRKPPSLGLALAIIIGGSALALIVSLFVVFGGQ